MSQDVNNLAQLIQSIQVDEAWSQGIVKNGGQGVNEGRQAGALPILTREKVVKQLVLILTDLHDRHGDV